jgi:hypothetical protein
MDPDDAGGDDPKAATRLHTALEEAKARAAVVAPVDNDLKPFWMQSYLSFTLS